MLSEGGSGVGRERRSALTEHCSGTRTSICLHHINFVWERLAILGKRKNKKINDAILQAATQLFAKVGYTNSTIPMIARAAGIPTSSVYVYFKSKLEIAFAVYEPWLQRHLAKLDQELSILHEPRERLRCLLRRIWRDIPTVENCFANNIIQAVSTSTPGTGYRPSIPSMLMSKISAIIYANVLPDRRSLSQCERIARLVVMAFDGFVINSHLPQHLVCDDETIDFFCDAVLLTTRSEADIESPHDFRLATPAKRSKRLSNKALG
jgi:AcrR family transcriptional regulator